MIKRKINEKQPPAPERHLEDIDSKLDLVLEGHKALDKEIGDFWKEVGEKFNEADYKFEFVFDELHLIRNELEGKNQPG
jgi:hypothetical protein